MIYINNYIYVDNSSTTKLNNLVLYRMLPYLNEYYGNASTLNKLGRKSKEALDVSRKKIASCLNVKPEEIYFTGSGTEADNIALIGMARANKGKGKHIITSAFEHFAVLNSCKRLEKEGFKVSYIPVNKDGIVDIDKLKEAIREDTILISIMYVNNEIGTIQNVEEIAKIAKDKNIIFHTDAVQAVPHIRIDASKFDALSISSHKFNGPKGVGALYVKKGIDIENIIYGGHQECGIRPGTENFAGIFGMAEALSLTYSNIDKNNIIERNLSNYLLRGLSDINGFKLNGSLNKRVSSILNFMIEDVDSKELKLFLDMNGVYASVGSACNSSSEDISHVLKAIGETKSGIRISLSYNNNYQEMDKIIKIIKNFVAKTKK